MLDRPLMYASSPEALAEVLRALDEVRRFVHGIQSETDRASRGYGPFLMSKGYGAASFTTRERPLSKDPTDDRELFSRLVAFWREYLRRE